MMTDLEIDCREAIAEGAAIELLPNEEGPGWYVTIADFPFVVTGRTRAEVFLKIAELFLEPDPVVEQ